MKPKVLLLAKLPAALAERLHLHFDCHDYAQLASAELQALAPRVRGIVSREMIARLPALEIISVLGVGYDGIDTEAARERKVRVTHTPGVLTDDGADEKSFVEALRERRILAAGLDVFCHEPDVPAALLALDNVVLSPHMASTTGATMQGMLELAIANLRACFGGAPLPTAVEAISLTVPTAPPALETLQKASHHADL